MPKLTHHFTTLNGTPGLTRSIRQYVVVDSDTARIHLATDDGDRATQLVVENTHLELIDLRKEGRTAKPRQPKAAATTQPAPEPTPDPEPAPEPEPEPAYVSLGGRKGMRHLPMSDGGALCKPGAVTTPATGDGPVCKKCTRIDGGRD